MFGGPASTLDLYNKQRHVVGNPCERDGAIWRVPACFQKVWEKQDYKNGFVLVACTEEEKMFYGYQKYCYFYVYYKTV